MKTQNRLNSRGFTLMEIMLVVVIIGILAASVMPKLVRQIPFVQNKRTNSDIITLSGQLDTYYMQNNDYPSTEQGLRALIQKPTSSPIPKNWNGPYIKKVPLDPWSREYKYKCPGDHNPDEYDLWSTGKDGQDGTEDDIDNWSEDTASN